MVILEASHPDGLTGVSPEVDRQVNPEVYPRSDVIHSAFWDNWLVFIPGCAPVTAQVLVVDDQPAFRRAAARVLARLPNFELIGESETGEASVEAARQLKPALVLMDVHLPGISGRSDAPHPGRCGRTHATANRVPAFDLRRSGLFRTRQRHAVRPRTWQRLISVLRP